MLCIFSDSATCIASNNCMSKKEISLTLPPALIFRFLWEDSAQTSDAPPSDIPSPLISRVKAASIVCRRRKLMQLYLLK